MIQLSKFLFLSCFVSSLNAQDNLPKKGNLKKTLNVINLFDDELTDENGEVASISGIFSATDDIYLNTVGFEFQGVFYKARGLGTEQTTFLLNGVHQNRLYDDRPAWNNWGGVDGIYQTQIMTEPLGRSKKTFGRGLGVTELSTRASKFKSGTRVSYARSNRSYQNKTAVNHASSFSKNWYYLISASKRWGSKAYKQGTFYKASSLLVSLERYLNQNHSINFSFLYTPNTRGASGFYTDEVYALKGNTYNGNWGFQDEKKRNSRIRHVKEPLFLLTHTYKKKATISWQNTVLLQKGTSGYSRIDFNRGNNPDPTYYQKLPSYWLSRNKVDFENVYQYQQEFLNNGQLDWNSLYKSNSELKAAGKNAVYILYDDKRDENRIQFNSNISQKINENWQLNASLDLRKTQGHYYAKLLDLLGGTAYLDVANFTQAQSNLNKPNRLVVKGDTFKYNYTINSSQTNGFVQIDWKITKLEISNAVGFTYVSHQRKGFYNYENSTNSLGKSKKVNRYAFQEKLNVLYKFSNRNLLNFKTAYIQKTPNIKQIFPNARVSNSLLHNLRSENLFSNSLSYIHRGLGYKAKITGYYNLQTNATTNRFYFAQGFGTNRRDDEADTDLLNGNSLFVQEVLNGIHKKYVGLEFGGSYRVTTSLKLIGVLGLGDYRFNNNPNVLLYAEDDKNARELGFVNGVKNIGNSTIKNKKLSSGPQQAFSLKLAYSDPSYWRINVSVNHFRNNFVSIAPIRYTSNFTTEINGAAIKDIDPNLIRLFKAQEKLKNFTLINLSGGKSWLLKKGYMSVFWTLQNVLNINYKTGGFSSSRAANYSEQLKEHRRELPLFGNRYFAGNGRTFFTGIYYSF